MGKPVHLRFKSDMAARQTMPGSDGRPGRRLDHPPENDLIFSLIDDYVWVSWPHTVASVKLGAPDPVKAMMRDFLAQCELGDRLANARATGE